MPKPPLPTHTLFCLLCALCFARAGAAQPAPDAYPLIPYPTFLVPAPGSFSITRTTRLALPGAAQVFKQEAGQLQALLSNGLGQPLKRAPIAAANTILLAYDPAITAPEGYRLTITSPQVTLASKEAAGIFWAVQTVRQLLPTTVETPGPGAPLRLPAVRIQDQPAYAWRGMHLDVARHFFSVEHLKKHLDLLAFHKINKLHLTDDQGWRIKIKRYPELTALAEVVWTNKPDYNGYLQRLKQHYARLARLGVHCRVPDLASFAEESVFTTSTAQAMQKPLADLIVHCTTSGSAPTSPILAKPLPISQSTTVKPADYTLEELKDNTCTLHYQQQDYAAPIREKTPEADLQATYFDGYFKPATRMQKATAKGNAVVAAVAIPKQTEANKFGVQFRGYLDVPATSIYTFYLTCDDGGARRIADYLVVDNDGLHSAIEKSGQVALAKDLQPLALDFVKGGSGYTLRLQYSQDGGAAQPVPAS